MRRLFPSLAAALLVLAGCKHEFKTACYEDDLAMAVAEGAEDSLLFSVNLEYVTGGVEEAAMARINGTLATVAFDQGDEAGLEETAIQYREQVIDEYLTEFSGAAVDGPRSWEESIEGMFTQDYKKLKNYTLTYYSQLGNNPATYTINYLVFDPETGELVPEDAFFQEGWREPVAEILRASLRKSLTENGDEEVLELIDWDALAPNGNYCVDAGGMEWAFQPYEVGAYVYTLMSANAGWDELKPYLK